MLSPFFKKEEKIKYVDIHTIQPNRYQPRTVFNEADLEELAQSIKEHGVIQPLTVRKMGDGYELIIGERRLRASKMVGLEQVPVIVKEYDDKATAAIALVENLQRKDLDFMEEAHGYYQLIQQFGMTQQELAEKVGKSQSTIANKLRLLKLPEDIQKSLVEHNLTERHARSLLKLETEEDQRIILEEVISKELNVRDTDLLINTYVTKKQENKKKVMIRVFKDMRLYTNTLWATIKQMRQGGLDIKVEETEGDDFIEFKIRLPKTQE